MAISFLAFAFALRQTSIDVPANFLAESGAVGVSVAVVREGKLSEAQAGFADRETKRPVAQSTLFRLGSVSKSVTAVLAMQLVQGRKLDLDAPFSTFLPGYDDKEGKITVRRLLSHTAGIRHYIAGRRESYYEAKTTAQALETITPDPLIAPPGEKYSYSTHAFTLAAAAIEKSSGKAFPSYVADSLRKVSPALTCEVLAESKPARSQLYTRRDATSTVEAGKREDLSWKYAGGGMESTAGDLARFGYAVLDGSLLRPTALAEMWTPQTLNSGPKTDYGLGWQVSANGTRRHSGSQQGCSSILIVDPVNRIAVAVLANTSGVGENVQRLANELLAKARGK